MKKTQNEIVPENTFKLRLKEEAKSKGKMYPGPTLGAAIKAFREDRFGSDEPAPHAFYVETFEDGASVGYERFWVSKDYKMSPEEWETQRRLHREINDKKEYAKAQAEASKK